MPGGARGGGKTPSPPQQPDSPTAHLLPSPPPAEHPASSRSNIFVKRMGPGSPSRQAGSQRSPNPSDRGFVQTWNSSRSHMGTNEDEDTDGGNGGGETESKQFAPTEVKTLLVPRRGLDMDIALLHAGRYCIQASSRASSLLTSLVPNRMHVQIAVSRLGEFAAAEGLAGDAEFNTVPRDEDGFTSIMGHAAVSASFHLYVGRRQSSFEFALGSRDVPARVSVRLSTSLLPMPVVVELFSEETASTVSARSLSNWIGMSAVGIGLAPEGEDDAEGDDAPPLAHLLDERGLGNAEAEEKLGRLGFTKKCLNEIAAALGNKVNVSLRGLPTLKFHDAGKEAPAAETPAVAPASRSGEQLAIADASVPVTIARKHGPPLLPLQTSGGFFVEQGGYDRSVILRGVNLSSNAKLPIGYTTQQTYDWSMLRDPANLKSVSFVGRPFPLQEAAEHLSRLERWGFNCVRFLVTWEAIAHAGPTEFDEAYLDYVEEVVRLAGEYGLYVFIDPHQDVWSRATGGSGAPIWTLELCGLDVGALTSSLAAFTHASFSPADPRQFPRMTWPQNYQRFACLHVFTLFFAGKEYCPAWMVAKSWKPGDGAAPAPADVVAAEGAVNIQDFLQSAYIDAVAAVAQRVGKFAHVIGFDVFNEPSAGFVGKRLDALPETIIPPGLVFSPGNAMITSAGLTAHVPRANGIGMLSQPEPVAPPTSVWLAGAVDPWRAAGVWKQVDSTGVVLRADFFTTRSDGTVANWFRDFLVPFAERYRARLRLYSPKLILFLEGDAFGHDDFFWPAASGAENVCNATHWYDGATLFMRRFHRDWTINVRTKMVVLGRSRVRALHAQNLAYIAHLPKESVSLARVKMPTLIGEFGIPYDLNGEVGLRTGNFTQHDRALSMYYSIFDEQMLNSTQWNYSCFNSNEWGDNWNMENLSIFSPDQQHNRDDPDSGARGLLGFCRPYAPVVCGARVSMRFDDKSGVVSVRYFPHPHNFDVGKMTACTIVYIPDVHFSTTVVDQQRLVELDARSPRTSAYRGAVPSSQRQLALNVVVTRGTYLMHRLPGRHVLYVWALSTRQVFGALEPIEVRVSRTGKGVSDVDCLGVCC